MYHIKTAHKFRSGFQRPEQSGKPFPTQFGIHNIKDSHLLFGKTVTSATGIWKLFSIGAEAGERLGLTCRFIRLGFRAQYFTHF